MSNFLSKQEYTCGKFSLELYPYLAIPENRFEPGAALQYGADFKLSFERGGAHKNPMGIIQFIKAQTAVGQHPAQTRCLDTGSKPASLPECLYGKSGHTLTMGKYQGEKVTGQSPNRCYMIDTPREILTYEKDGGFTKSTLTEFTNFILEIDASKSTLFTSGIRWFYEYRYNPGKPGTFDVIITPPQEVKIDPDKHGECGAILKGFGITF